MKTPRVSQFYRHGLEVGDVVGVSRGPNKNVTAEVLEVTPRTVYLKGVGNVLTTSLSIPSIRRASCKRAGVTWEWLREDLSVPEAEEWLGIDTSTL